MTPQLPAKPASKTYGGQFFRSLRFRLLLFGMVLAIVPVLILGVMVYLFTQDQLHTLTTRELEKTASSQKLAIQNWVQERLGDMEDLANTSRIRSGDPVQVQEAIDQYFTLWKIYESVFMARLPDGEGIYTTDKLPSFNLGARRYFQLATQGQAVVDGPVVSRGTQNIIVVVAVPVYGLNGEIIGVLGAAVPTSDLVEILEPAWTGSTGEAYMVMQTEVDVNGEKQQKIVFASPSRFAEDLIQQGAIEKRAELELANDSLGARQALAGNSGVKEYTNYRGYPVVGAYQPISNTQWGLVVEQASSEAFASVTTFRTLIILIVLALSVVGATGTFLVVNRLIARPLGELTDTAMQIADGNLALRATIHGDNEISALAASFNAMTSQLNNLIGSLEQRIAERTRMVEASAEVSRHLSTILDQRQLLLAVVEEVKNAFDYYHAHIYLFDEARENLVMMGGTGDAGQAMLSRGHQIARGRGLVGRAAETNQVVLVPNTQADPNWLPNPLLPDTLSEVALPISIGDHILGVLDVQHNVVEGFSPQDITLLEAIASQVAVAVQNASLYSQAQHLAERESLVNEIGQKIQTASSVDDVLQVMARELGLALRAQRTYVQLGGAQRNAGTPPSSESE